MNKQEDSMFDRLTYTHNFDMSEELVTKRFSSKSFGTYSKEKNQEGNSVNLDKCFSDFFRKLESYGIKTYDFFWDFKNQLFYLLLEQNSSITGEELQESFMYYEYDKKKDQIIDDYRVIVFDISKIYTYNRNWAEKLFSENENLVLNRKMLNNEIKKQQKEFDSSQGIYSGSLKMKIKGNPLDELNELLGLKEAKKQIKDLINIAEIDEIRKINHLNTLSGVSKHMIFTGNPGTGKSTVARIFAKIMFENGVIKENKFMRVSRTDLVGPYIGSTAKQTKRVIEKARGGVLLVDEAYELYKEDSHDFGHEAIKTLLTELENNRDDLIIIFAGYTVNMEQFLDDNPGIRSRIPNRINFSDYNKDELIQIVINNLAKDHFILENDAYLKDKVGKYIEMNNPQGNARWARNFVQKLRSNQNVRLVFMKDKTKDELQTILNVDIDKTLNERGEKS